MCSVPLLVTVYQMSWDKIIPTEEKNPHSFEWGFDGLQIISGS